MENSLSLAVWMTTPTLPPPLTTQNECSPIILYAESPPGSGPVFTVRAWQVFTQDRNDQVSLVQWFHCKDEEIQDTWAIISVCQRQCQNQNGLALWSDWRRDGVLPGLAEWKCRDRMRWKVTLSISQNPKLNYVIQRITWFLSQYILGKS